MSILRALLEMVQRYFAKRESQANTSKPPLPFLGTGEPPPPPVPFTPPLDPPPIQTKPVRFTQWEDGPLGLLIPRGQAAVVRAFGDPGLTRTAVDTAWEKKHMVIAKDLPGKWNGGKGRLYCHRLAEPYLREALRRCEALGVLDYIEKLGCFNFRHMRHDARMPLSRHSWGIAVDINSADNSGKYISVPPKPFSPDWWKLYPQGLPEALVHAFESTGWYWGGRWKGFVDPMHFEL